MGFISIFHHHLGGIFLFSFPTTVAIRKSKFMNWGDSIMGLSGKLRSNSCVC